MEDQLKPKKIGVIVDSASLHHLMRIIGIGQVNLKKLLEVICREVSQAIQAPVTIGFAQYITAAQNPGRFEKRVKVAGFQFIPTDPCVKDSDDQEVNRRIVLADQEHIAALIVVTADLLDYVRSLEEKRAQNIQIFVAAITASESDGGFPLSMHSRQIIKENEYTLIDLEKYKKELLITQWVDRIRPDAIRASLENGDEGATEELMIHSDAGHLNLHEWIDARCVYLYLQVSAYAGKQDLAGIECAGEEISFLLDLARTTRVPYKRVQKKRAQKTAPKEEDEKQSSWVTFIEKAERHEKILCVLRRHQSASIGTLLQEISDVGAVTLQRDLRGLKAKGIIQSTGERRWTRYMLGTAREEEVNHDRLIDIADAAKRLGVSEDWLSHHWSEYPFSRKLSKKKLRFSASGIDAWKRNNG